MGNRLSKSDTTGGTTTTTSYTVDAANRLTAAGGNAYTNDADGNITLKVIYTGAGESMNVEARIVGVSEVTGTDPSREAKANTIRAIIVGAVVPLFTLLYSVASGAKKERRLREEIAELNKKTASIL